MNNKGSELQAKSKKGVLSLLKQNRHLLANRLINTYQEELGLDPVDEGSLKGQDLNDPELVGMTTVDQRLDSKKNLIPDFKSQQLSA